MAPLHIHGKDTGTFCFHLRIAVAPVLPFSLIHKSMSKPFVSPSVLGRFLRVIFKRRNAFGTATAEQVNASPISFK